jgi:hypothetical protein
MTETIHRQLDRNGLLPAEHVVDAGYTSADLIVSSQAGFGVELLGPLRTDPGGQAKAGYARASFTIDWDGQTVTCPQGVASTIWSPCDERGRASIVVRFPTKTCQACPVRADCTSSTKNGRQLMLRPQPIHEAVEAARAAQTTQAWKDRYAIRAGVESTMHQAVTRTGVRRSRYIGLAKTHLSHVFTAAAINIVRLEAWWTDTRPLEKTTRTSHLSRLVLTT